MLDNLNKDIDDTQANMIRVEGKMTNLMKKSSTCGLLTILIVEFLILILLIYLNL
jgi:hypothetical protein